MDGRGQRPPGDFYLYYCDFVGASNLDPAKVDLFRKSLQGRVAASNQGKDADRLISLSTISTKEVRSRTYLLRADSPELREKWLAYLEPHIARESKRAMRANCMLYYQDCSRKAFTNVWLRWFFAMAILASFVIDALEMQYLPLGRSRDWQGNVFFWLEFSFTVLFALELIWNMFSYW